MQNAGGVVRKLTSARPSGQQQTRASEVVRRGPKTEYLVRGINFHLFYRSEVTRRRRSQGLSSRRPVLFVTAPAGFDPASGGFHVQEHTFLFVSDLCARQINTPANITDMRFDHLGVPRLIRTAHSIASSARPRRRSGTLRPSALAVLRLIIMNSTFAACWTGISAGLSPQEFSPHRCRDGKERTADAWVITESNWGFSNAQMSWTSCNANPALVLVLSTCFATGSVKLTNISLKLRCRRCRFDWRRRSFNQHGLAKREGRDPSCNS